MADLYLNLTIPGNSPSTTVNAEVLGLSNHTPLLFMQHTSNSVSYTVQDDQSEEGPSQPLSPGSVRVMDSVLRARVPDSAFRRE